MGKNTGEAVGKRVYGQQFMTYNGEAPCYLSRPGY
jgi:hypothetical protein